MANMAETWVISPPRVGCCWDVMASDLVQETIPTPSIEHHCYTHGISQKNPHRLVADGQGL